MVIKYKQQPCLEFGKLKNYSYIYNMKLKINDRTEHVPTFKQYFEGLVESGRLDSYNVTIVPSGNHG